MRRYFSWAGIGLAMFTIIFAVRWLAGDLEGSWLWFLPLVAILVYDAWQTWKSRRSQ